MLAFWLSHTNNGWKGTFSRIGSQCPYKHFALGLRSVLRQRLHRSDVGYIAVCKVVRRWSDIATDDHLTRFLGLNLTVIHCPFNVHLRSVERLQYYLASISEVSFSRKMVLFRTTSIQIGLNLIARSWSERLDQEPTSNRRQNVDRGCWPIWTWFLLGNQTPFI